MKITKAGTVLILMLLALCASADDKNTKAKGAELEFTVEPTKLVFLENEPVEIKFGVRNISSHKVLVAKTFALTQFVDLDAFDAQGKRAPWCGRISGLIESRRSYAVLNPNESVFATLVISCTHKEDPAKAWGYSLGRPRRYEIRATYHLPEPSAVYKKMFPGVPVVFGPISSTPVTIELK